jgi:hypothetical protein
MPPKPFTSWRNFRIRGQSIALGASQFLVLRPGWVESISSGYGSPGKHTRSKCHIKSILPERNPSKGEGSMWARYTSRSIQIHTSWWTMTLSGRISLMCLASVVFPEHVAPLQKFSVDHSVVETVKPELTQCQLGWLSSWYCPSDLTFGSWVSARLVVDSDPWKLSQRWEMNTWMSSYRDILGSRNERFFGCRMQGCPITVQSH